jgi:hypothetical protein
MTRLALVLAAVATVLAAGSAQADKIGVASIITNNVQGSGPPRALAVGGDVFSAERIRTGDASTAQLLFLDSTSVNVGARSELTLDRFVYNPSRGAGNVVLTASKGAFRFITGSQNPTNYSIKTPVATIGVRGTIVGVQTQTLHGVTTTAVTLYEGKVIITTLWGQTFVLDKPNTTYVIKSDRTVQGPLKGNGSVYTFLGDPKLFQLPDDRFDMLGAVGPFGSRPSPSSPASPAGGETTPGPGPGPGSGPCTRFSSVC